MLDFSFSTLGNVWEVQGRHYPRGVLESLYSKGSLPARDSGHALLVCFDGFRLPFFTLLPESRRWSDEPGVSPTHGTLLGIPGFHHISRFAGGIAPLADALNIIQPINSV